MDPTAGAEIPRYAHPARLTNPNQIVEHLVNHRLVKNPLISKIQIVILQAFQLDAHIARNVFKFDCSEIGQPSLRANAGELWVHVLDRVIAVWVRIWKRLKLNHGEAIVYFLIRID